MAHVGKRYFDDNMTFSKLFKVFPLFCCIASVWTQLSLRNMENVAVSETWSYLTVFNGLLGGTVENRDLFIELNELSGQSERRIAEYEKYTQRDNYTRRNTNPTEEWHSLLGNGILPDFNVAHSPRINRQPKLNFCNKNFRKKGYQLQPPNPDDKLAYNVPAMYSR
ncbi:uncharacterized protein LOC130696348 [Daphnia carinata]|uniref:uncharacterized protein LOC130696348 n=1 Tax=Daphnia carinata TaxID=120202 RepID=UPI00257A867E|nr:uncharacterized protein LOC130696348 [Daphnia carinata]